MLPAFFVAFIFIFVSIFSSFSFAEAAINKEINYQGKLTTSDNIAVTNGTYNMQFRLYNTGGAVLWTETRTGGDRVQITSGLFSVMLGEISSLAGVDFNQTLYLGVNIGGLGVTPTWDGEMTPRKKLGVVPAAVESEKSAKSTSLVGGNSTTLLGSIPYQSDTDITSFVSPNIETTRKFFTMTGTGTNGAIPVWGTMNAGDVGLGNVTNESKETMFTSPTFTGNTLISGSLTVADTITTKSYSSFGSNSTSHGLTEPDDVLFSGNVEIDGNLYLDASTIELSETTVNDNLQVDGVLKLSDGTALSPSYTFISDTDTGLFRGGTNSLGFSTAGAERMRIDSNGNVGIGTLVPGFKLEVSDSGSPAMAVVDTTNNTTTFVQSLDSVGAIGTISNHPLGLYANSSRAATILTNGNFGVGTVTPSTTFEVGGGLRVSGNLVSQTYTNQIGASISTDYVQSLIEGAVYANGTSSSASINSFVVSPSAVATSTGATSVTGASFYPRVYSTNTSANISAVGLNAHAIRYNSSDISTNTNNSLSGGVYSAGHQAGAGGSIVTGTASGLVSTIVNGSGTINISKGLSVNTTVGTTVNSSGSTGNHYGIYTQGTAGATSGTGTGSITNYYDAYLAGVTVASTGSVTNKYGLYQSATDHINYFGGKVGVGTTTPLSKLNVQGDSDYIGSLTQGQIIISGATDTTKRLAVGFDTTDNFAFIASGVAGSGWNNLALNPSGGNVGIGTTTPEVLLHAYKTTESALLIETGDSSNAALYLANNSGEGKIGYFNSLLTFRNASSGAAHMVLDSNGNIGIGTTTPGEQLAVQYTGTANTLEDVMSVGKTSSGNMTAGGGSAIVFRNKNYSSSTVMKSGRIGVINTADVLNATNPAMVFQLGNAESLAEKMRIDVNGNVGIGTTAPGGLLEIAQSSGVNYPRISRSGMHTWGFSSTNNGTNDTLNFVNVTDGTNPVVIDKNGNVGIGTTAPYSKLQISDANKVASTLSSTVNFSIQASDTQAIDIGGSIGLGGHDGTGGNDLTNFGVISGRKSNGVGGDSSGYLSFSTHKTAVGLTERMRIDKDGNVGIGTTNPVSKLEIDKTASDTISQANSDFFFGSKTLDVGLLGQQKLSSPYAYVLQSGTQSMTVFTPMALNPLGGNVGVGTTTPESKLQIVGATGSMFQLTDSSSFYYAKQNATSIQAYTNTNDASSFNINPSGGNVGIGTTNPSSFKLQVAGNVGPETDATYDLGSSTKRWKDLHVSGGISQGGYLATDMDNLVYNGDFEMGTTGWDAGATVSGGYSGKYALQVWGDRQLLSSDYIPVDPDYDTFQLEGYFKKSVAGATPGILYFGYIAYDENKNAVTSSPCGTYCYFAASSYVIPADGNWHKLSATTTGEGVSYPNFPVGTKFVRVLGLVNYGGSSDATTLIDHISIKKINNGPLFVGNNFTGSNMPDQYQTSKIYTTALNSLVLEPSNLGNVGIGTTTPGYKLDVNGDAKFLTNVLVGGSTMLTEDGTGILKFGLAGGTQTAIYSSSAERIRINSAGNVGIGTTTPAQLLDIGLGTTDGTTKDALIRTSARTSGGGTRSWDFGTTASNLGFYIKDTGMSDPALSILYNSGNVGIGTTTPSQKFEVNGVTLIGNTTSGGDLRMEGVGGSSYQWRIKTSVVAGLDFAATNGIGHVTFLDTGNVGIGTATPGAKLDVAGNIYASSGGIKLGYGSPAYGVGISSSGATGGGWSRRYGFFNANTDALMGGFGALGSNNSIDYYWVGSDYDLTSQVWLPNGNVGIGTTTPAQKLHVYGNGAASQILVDTSSGSFDPSIALTTLRSTAEGLKIWYDASVGDVYFDSVYNASAGDIHFRTKTAGTPVDALFIESAGNIGIGTAVPDAKLTIHDGNMHLTSTTALSSFTTINPSHSVAILGASAVSNYNSNDRDTWIFKDPYTTSNWGIYSRNIESADNGLPANSIGFVGNTLLRAFIDLSNGNGYFSGNVGVGITSPVTTLHVVGNGGNDFTLTDANSYTLQMGSGGSSIASIKGDAGSALALGSNNVEQIRISAGGNVGIGEIAPVAKLHIVSDATNSNQPSGIQASSDTHTGLYLGSSGNTIGEKYGLQFGGWTNYSLGGIFGVGDSSSAYSSGDITFDMRAVAEDSSLTERMRITHEGNIGIGTTSPASKLHIYQATPDTDGLVIQTNVTNSDGAQHYGALSFQEYADKTGNYSQIRSYSNLYSSWGSQLAFYVTSGGSPTLSEAMRIIPSGNVGIGTSNPATKLDIAGSAQGYGTAPSIQLSDTVGNIDSRKWRISNVATNWGDLNFMVGRNNADDPDTIADIVMTLNKAGNVGIGTTTPGTGNRLNVKGATPTLGISYGNSTGNLGQLVLESSDSYTTQKGGRIVFSGNASDGGGAFAGQTRLDSGFGSIEGYKYNATANHAGGGLIFSTNFNDNGVLTERMRIDNAGNIGIGTASPSAKLQVSGGKMGIASTSNVNGQFRIANTSDAEASMGFFTGLTESTFGNTYPTATHAWMVGPSVWGIGTNKFGIGNTTDGAPNLVIQEGGNVGIGTSTPNGKLQIGNNLTATTLWTSGGTYSANEWNTLNDASTDGLNGTVGLTIHNNNTTDGNWARLSFSTYEGSGGNNIAAAMIAARFSNRAVSSWGDGDLAFSTNYNDGLVERMRILANGNVGIGRTDPQTPLNIYKTPTSGFVEQIRVGGTGNYPSLQLGTYGAYDGYIGTAGNDLRLLAGKGVATENHAIHFFTSFNGSGGAAESNERMTIQYDGNVGIGTTSPASRLSISGQTTPGIQINSSAYPTTYPSYFGVRADASGVLQMGNNASNDFVLGGTGAGGYLRFIVNNTNQFPTAPNGTVAMTILANGKVGIGTTAPASTLSVGGVGVAGYGVYGTASEAGVVGEGTYYGVRGNGNSVGVGVYGDGGTGVHGNGVTYGVYGDGGYAGVFGSGSTYDFMGSGGEYAGNGDWTNTSDRNKKENFTELDNQEILNKIISLPMTKWNYKANPNVSHIGPIAQDFYSIFEIGNNDTSISTVDPAGVALVGIKALSEKINEQGGKIEELESLNLSLGAISGTIIPTVGSEEETFANNFFTNVFARVSVWLGDVENGLEKIFVKEVRTKRLCVLNDDGEETCVEKIQLDALLASAGESGAGPSDGTPTDGGEAQINPNAPVVTLNGEAVINLIKGDTYEEQGATVTDDVDVDLVATVDGTVDTSVAGSYTLTYVATDTEGNMSIPVTRIVNVAEEEAPASAPAPAPTPAPATDTTTLSATTDTTSTPATTTPTSDGTGATGGDTFSTTTSGDTTAGDTSSSATTSSGTTTGGDTSGTTTGA